MLQLEWDLLFPATVGVKDFVPVFTLVLRVGTSNRVRPILSRRLDFSKGKDTLSRLVVSPWSLRKTSPFTTLAVGF